MTKECLIFDIYSLTKYMDYNYAFHPLNCFNENKIISIEYNIKDKKVVDIKLSTKYMNIEIYNHEDCIEIRRSLSNEGLVYLSEQENVYLHDIDNILCRVKIKKEDIKTKAIVDLDKIYIMK